MRVAGKVKQKQKNILSRFTPIGTKSMMYIDLMHFWTVVECKLIYDVSLINCLTILNFESRNCNYAISNMKNNKMFLKTISYKDHNYVSTINYI